MFQQYTNLFANATRKIAGGLLSLGLFLLGLAALVLLFKAIVIFIIAGLLFFGGMLCIFKAIGMFFQLFRSGDDNGQTRVYRKNVRIHHHDEGDEII